MTKMLPALWIFASFWILTACAVVIVGAGAGAVVAGEQLADQPTLDHFGGQGVGQIEMRDRLGFAQHGSKVTKERRGILQLQI